MQTENSAPIAAWIDLQILEKRFASVEDALMHLVTLDQPAISDMTWAKPLVDAADHQIARGQTVPAEEAFSRVMATLGS